MSRDKGKSQGMAGDGVRHVVERLVPDPSMSDAEFYHLRRVRGGDGVGKVAVAVNLVELIGGLARIESRTVVQEEAAARYRKLWDSAQLGGARAVDYAKARVDTSGSSEEAVFEIGEAARREMARLRGELGAGASRLLDRVIIHDESLRAVAGKGARGRARVQCELMDALDLVADHFRLGKPKRGA